MYVYLVAYRIPTDNNPEATYLNYYETYNDKVVGLAEMLKVSGTTGYSELNLNAQPSRQDIKDFFLWYIPNNPVINLGWDEAEILINSFEFVKNKKVFCNLLIQICGYIGTHLFTDGDVYNLEEENMVLKHKLQDIGANLLSNVDTVMDL